MFFFFFSDDLGRISADCTFDSVRHKYSLKSTWNKIFSVLPLQTLSGLSLRCWLLWNICEQCVLLNYSWSSAAESIKEALPHHSQFSSPALPWPPEPWLYATSLHTLGLTSSASLSIRSKPHHFLLNRYPLTYICFCGYVQIIFIFMSTLSHVFSSSFQTWKPVHDVVTDSCEMKRPLLCVTPRQIYWVLSFYQMA